MPSSRTSSPRKPRRSASAVRRRSTSASAFDRSRKVADGRVKGVHFLMKKNKITEIDGRGTFTDANTLAVELNDGRHRDGHVRQRDHRHRQQHAAAARHVAVGERRHLRGADPRPASCPARSSSSAPARSAWSSRYVLKQLRRRRHDRRVPAACAAQRGRRGLQGDRQAVQEARRQDPHRHQGRVDRRRRRAGHRHRQQGRQDRASSRPTRCCSPSASRRNVEGFGLENTGVAADRARRDRHRRLHAHQRAAHLRDRRRHRQAAARPRRRGAGRRRRRDDRAAPRRWRSATTG